MTGGAGRAGSSHPSRGSAMPPVPSLVAAYLLATLVPLLASGRDPARLGVAALHLGVAVLFLREARRGPPEPGRRPGVMAWLPLLLVPGLYAELPLLNEWAGGYHDATVRGWEALLFPSDPSSTWAGRAPSLFLSELLHAGYLAYYPLIYLPALALWLRREDEAFRRTVHALLLAFLGCYVWFVIFPVLGPRYLNPAPPGIPEGPVRALSLAVLEAGSSRGAAFPSSHVAVGVTQAIVGLRYFGRSGWFFVVVAVLLSCGAVYGGFHYAVDALAGAGVAGVAGWVAIHRGPERHEPGPERA